MKKIIVAGLCIFFLISFCVYAQNETNASAAPDTSAPADEMPAPAASKPKVNLPRQQLNETAACNKDKKADPGETCANCPSDIKCEQGEACNLETGECEGQLNFTTYLILGIGLVVLFGMFFVVKRLIKKKEEPAQQPMGQNPLEQPPALLGQAQQPTQAQPSQPQQAPSALGQQPAPQKQSQAPAQPQQQAQPSPVANAKIQMPPSMAAPGEKSQKPSSQPEEKAPEEPEDGHANETMPQKFVRQMREKGWNDERIRMKMKEAGWKETQIALEFLKSPKFVKKQ